jgi:hypothetical protein
LPRLRASNRHGKRYGGDERGGEAIIRGVRKRPITRENRCAAIIAGDTEIGVRDRQERGDDGFARWVAAALFRDRATGRRFGAIRRRFGIRHSSSWQVPRGPLTLTHNEPSRHSISEMHSPSPSSGTIAVGRGDACRGGANGYNARAQVHVFAP